MSMPTFDKDLNLRRLLAAQGSLAVVVNSERNNLRVASALAMVNQEIMDKMLAPQARLQGIDEHPQSEQECKACQEWKREDAGIGICVPLQIKIYGKRL